MNCKNRNCVRFSCPYESKLVTEIATKEDFDFGSALQSVYPLLDIVFDYLGVNDLKNASLVKKSWEPIVNELLMKRNKLSWMTIRNNDNGTECIVDCSKKFNYYEPEFGIILSKSKQSINICLHEKPNYKGCRMKKLDFLNKNKLLNGINYCIVKCQKIDSTADSNKNLFDFCLLPKIPNIRIASAAYQHYEDCCKSLNVKESEVVKCVLFFQNHRGKTAVNVLEQIVAVENCEKVAVGGGVIDENQLFLAHTKTPYKKTKNICIAFLENKDNISCFSASSIVICNDDFNNLMTPQKFEETLTQFKNRLILRKNSIAFKFVCSCNRYIGESEIFKRIFPNTKLMGLHVYGEIGWNCFNNLIETDNDLGPTAKKLLKKGHRNVSHEFSTIIVILTWGDIIN